MSLSLQFSTHFYLASRMHAFLMTCTFGYVFLLSSAHKRRKFFLRTLVRLVKVAYANNSTLSQTSISAPAWFCRSVWVRATASNLCCPLSSHFEYALLASRGICWISCKFIHEELLWCHVIAEQVFIFLLSFTPEIWRFRVYGCVLAHALCNAG